MSLSVQRYHDPSEFLKETRQQLELYELEHIYPLWSTYKLVKQGLGNSYCGAVWKHDNDDQEQKTLVFAIVALDNDTVYPTSLFTQDEQERSLATRLLVEDFFAAPVKANKLRGYDPSLQMVKDTWKKVASSHSLSLNISFATTYPVCLSYISPTEERLKTSKALVSIQDQGYFLRRATTPEFPLLLAWTREYLIHHGYTFDENTSGLSSDYDFIELTSEFHLGSIFIWCTPDGLPVSMIWRRRPLGVGCSIGYVYTPEEFRGRGYASAMVATFTLQLLKTYKYVCLMVDPDQDEKKNLYARIGYQYACTIIRYQTSLVSNTAA